MGNSSSSSSQKDCTSSNLDASTMTHALEYVSQKLWTKTKTHHTFVVGGGAVSVLFFRTRNTTQDINLIGTSRIDFRAKHILMKAIKKASSQYNIPQDWVNKSMEDSDKIDAETINLIMQRSLNQKVVVFSSEGLTLLAVDFVYGLVSKLVRFSKKKEEDGQSKTDLEDMVELTRRLIGVEYKGKQLTRKLFEAQYPNLIFSLEAWEQLASAYFQKFLETGIVLREDDFDDFGEGSSTGVRRGSSTSRASYAGKIQPTLPHTQSVILFEDRETEPGDETTHPQ